MRAAGGFGREGVALHLVAARFQGALAGAQCRTLLNRNLYLGSIGIRVYDVKDCGAGGVVLPPELCCCGFLCPATVVVP